MLHVFACAWSLIAGLRRLNSPRSIECMQTHQHTHHCPAGTVVCYGPAHSICSMIHQFTFARFRTFPVQGDWKSPYTGMCKIPISMYTPGSCFPVASWLSSCLVNARQPKCMSVGQRCWPAVCMPSRRFMELGLPTGLSSLGCRPLMSQGWPLVPNLLKSDPTASEQQQPQQHSRISCSMGGRWPAAAVPACVAASSHPIAQCSKCGAQPCISKIEPSLPAQSPAAQCNSSMQHRAA